MDASMCRRLDALTRRRVDAWTRGRVDAAMRRRVHAWTRRRVHASTRRGVGVSRRLRLDAWTRRGVDASAPAPALRPSNVNPQHGLKILFVTSIFLLILQAKKRLLTLIKRPQLLNVHAYYTSTLTKRPRLLNVHAYYCSRLFVRFVWFRFDVLMTCLLYTSPSPRD